MLPYLYYYLMHGYQFSFYLVPIRSTDIYQNRLSKDLPRGLFCYDRHMLEYLGLLLIPLSWLALGYMLITWRGTYDMSISKHAASHKSAYKLFILTLVIGGLVFYYWLLRWFTPHLNLGHPFVFTLSLTILLQVIAGIIPDSTGWKHRVHQSTAYFMAVLYIPLTYLIVTSENISLTAQIISAACIAYIFLSAYLFFFVRKARNYYLIFQSLYIVSFQIIILSAAYI